MNIVALFLGQLLSCNNSHVHRALEYQSNMGVKRWLRERNKQLKDFERVCIFYRKKSRKPWAFIS